jgi:hypothetical protein
LPELLFPFGSRAPNLFEKLMGLEEIARVKQTDPTPEKSRHFMRISL